MSDPAPTTTPSNVGLPADSTLPQPGSCDPDVERLPAPSIVINGTSTDTSFGVGAYECGTISGDGYIVYSFNPVLLDASGPVQVRINSAASATITWSQATFSQTSPGVWQSTQPANGCGRLTIDLTSPGGENTATFGADVRIGGVDVACPQRTIDPTDPGDIGSVPVATPADNTLPPLGTFGTGNTLPSFSGVTTVPATTPTNAPSAGVGPTSTTRG